MLPICIYITVAGNYQSAVIKNTYILKKKFTVSTIIALFIFFVGKEILFPPVHKNEAAIEAMNFKKSVDQINSQKNNEDTTDILEALCERNINSNAKTFGLNVINYVPCKWQEDFASEKKGAVSAFYASVSSATVEMALLIDEIPYKVSEKQIKQTFSIEEIKKTSQEVNAIEYNKSTLSGKDGMKIIYKKDSTGVRFSTLYTIHFETIFQNKYITLSYSVGCKDKDQCKDIFYKYLPVFQNLYKKFTLK